MCTLAEGSAGMIRTDEIWLATEPLDMRAGPSGEGVRHGSPTLCLSLRQPPRNRMKVLVHDGLGVWLCARRHHHEPDPVRQAERPRALRLPEGRAETTADAQGQSAPRRALAAELAKTRLIIHRRCSAVAYSSPAMTKCLLRRKNA